MDTDNRRLADYTNMFEYYILLGPLKCNVNVNLLHLAHTSRKHKKKKENETDTSEVQS